MEGWVRDAVDIEANVEIWKGSRDNMFYLIQADIERE